MERILAAARDAGATSAGHVLLRLPLEIKDLFIEWLEAHAPGKAKHVLDIVRDTRNGTLNDATFGRRMTGQGNYAALIHQRFALAARKLGLDERDWRYDLSLFKPPAKAAPAPRSDNRQLSLLL
jgi:DNA repair photolyase